MKKIQSENLKRISGYGVAIAAVLGSATSKANIVYYPVDPDQTGTTTPTSTNSILLSFNLAGDVATDGSSVANEQFHASHGYKNKFLGPEHIYSSVLRFVGNSGAAFDPNPLSYGTLIGGGGITSGNAAKTPLAGSEDGSPTGGWSNGQDAYLGLQFDSGGTTNYGWAEITVGNAYTITLDGYAYEDSGGPILAGHTTGVVPEPSQMALFALGAVGVVAFRRRKKVA